ncbi:MAG: hypothetical protein WCO60_16745 [Verrucomicrobiota bacterium]
MKKENDSQGGSEAPEEEIRRLISNVSFNYNVCVLARGRYGLQDLARVAGLLAPLNEAAILRTLRLIDEVCEAHRCALCTIKLVAFARVFCRDRPSLSLEYARYTAEYNMLSAAIGSARDFQNEVEEVIQAFRRPARARKPRVGRVFPTDIRWFRGDYDFCED